METTQPNAQPKPPDTAAAPPANGTAAPPAQPQAAGEPAPDPSSKEGRWVAEQRAREAKLVEQQRQFARQRDEFENYKKQTTSQLTQEQQRAALAAHDPIRYLREVHGWDEDRITGRLLNGGKPTPLDKEAERDRELADLRKWRQAQEQAQTAQQQQKALGEAREAFAKTAQDATRWQRASQLKRDRLIAKGEQIAIEHARNGVQLSDEDILDKIEDELGEYESILSKTPKQATSTAGDTAPQAKPGTDTQPAPTLTNGKAAEVAGQKEPDMLKMSFEEQRTYLLRKLKEDRAKGLIVD